MKRLIIFCVFVFFITAIKASEKPAYIIYDSQGKKADYTQMLEAALKSEIVLFGDIMFQDLYGGGQKQKLIRIQIG